MTSSPGLNPNRFQGGFDRHRAGAYALGVFGGLGVGEFFCESLGVFSGERLAAPIQAGEDIFQCANSSFVERPASERGLAYGLATCNREFSQVQASNRTG